MDKRNILYRGRLRPVCRNCGRRYDLGEAVDIAERKRNRNVTCPSCNFKVGVSH
jgi:DNA-directed RNA polymerase subunit RPC12/RpoP